MCISWNTSDKYALVISCYNNWFWQDKCHSHTGQGILVPWYVGHVGYTCECLMLWIMLLCLVITVTLLTVSMSTVFCVYDCSAIVQGGLVCLIRHDPVCVCWLQVLLKS